MQFFLRWLSIRWFVPVKMIDFFSLLRFSFVRCFTVRASISAALPFVSAFLLPWLFAFSIVGMIVVFFLLWSHSLVSIFTWSRFNANICAILDSWLCIPGKHNFYFISLYVFAEIHKQTGWELHMDWIEWRKNEWLTSLVSDGK